MFEFRSANIRAVNPRRAVLELLETAYPDGEPDCELVLLNSTVGHDLGDLCEAVHHQCPGARILASSCAGVVGTAGPGELIHDNVLMGISGHGAQVAHVIDLFGSSSYAKGVELGQGLSQPSSWCGWSICWPPASISPTAR